MRPWWASFFLNVSPGCKWFCNFFEPTNRFINKIQLLRETDNHSYHKFSPIYNRIGQRDKFSTIIFSFLSFFLSFFLIYNVSSKICYHSYLQVVNSSWNKCINVHLVKVRNLSINKKCQKPFSVLKPAAEFCSVIIIARLICRIL